MKISVIDIVGEYALTIEDGQKLYDIIYPHLKNGNQIVLDFSGIHIFVCAFMNSSIGQLYKDFNPKGLLGFENVPSYGKDVIRAVAKNAKRYYSMTEEERGERDLAFLAVLDES